MALIPCPECQREVSTEALACPQCALPYPGKKERVNGNEKETVQTCIDCGQVLPMQSKTCPQCGAPNPIPQLEEPAVNEDVKEETWLCPHCGVPYTRRTKGAKTESIEKKPPSPIEPIPVSPPVVQENVLVRASEAKQDLLNEFVYQKERKKNPLWGEAHVVTEDISPQFPRPKKRLSWTFLVLLMIVLASLVSVAVMGLNGLNPLEALVYWQM